MNHHALLIIDIQNDYFPGGKWPLFEVEAAAEKASKILQQAREQGQKVIHVRHEFLQDDPAFFAPGSHGAEIHPSVAPLEGETVVVKNQVNSFLDTNLQFVLQQSGITQLTVMGAMSHMCIDAAVRAASDAGFDVTVVEDACASRDLEFKGQLVKAKDVHNAYMSALGFAYARVVDSAEYLASGQE